MIILLDIVDHTNYRLHYLLKLDYPVDIILSTIIISILEQLIDVLQEHLSLKVRKIVDFFWRDASKQVRSGYWMSSVLWKTNNSCWNKSESWYYGALELNEPASVESNLVRELVLGTFEPCLVLSEPLPQGVERFSDVSVISNVVGQRIVSSLEFKDLLLDVSSEWLDLLRCHCEMLLDQRKNNLLYHLLKSLLIYLHWLTLMIARQL